MRSLITPLAILLGSALHISASDDDDIVRMVKDLGGELSRDDKAPGKPIAFIVLAKATDKEVAILARLKALRGLSLHDSTVTDAALKGMSKLGTLTLDKTRI